MISIIIPTLNEENQISGLVENIFMLKGDFEIIFVDGGSDDRTVELFPSTAGCLFERRNRAVQMNRGAEVSKGEVLLFLHADTRLPENALKTIEKEISRGAVGGRFKVRLDEPGLIYRIIENGINSRDRITGGSTGDQAIFVRRDIFESLGGYREIPICEDLDFARRLKRAGKYIQLNEYAKTSARRWKKAGVIRVILLMWIIRFLFLLKVPPVFLKKVYGEVR